MRAALLLLLYTLTPVATSDEVHIAVAANFKQTAEVINAYFSHHSGHKVTSSSASTGTLHSQIVYGAPFDILLSADSNSPQSLLASGHGVTGTNNCYALGQLALVGGNDVSADMNNPGLSLSIANPATAPYGRAAQEVINKPEFAAGAGRKMVRGNSVVQAYQFWHSGSVDLALVARSLAPQDSALIPSNWYTAIEQHAVLLENGRSNQAAILYMQMLRSQPVQEIIGNAGYSNCP
ncbi:MAG: molybdate ABC transporter substrate-binding protein [Halioglobus sp.]